MGKPSLVVLWIGRIELLYFVAGVVGARTRCGGVSVWYGYGIMHFYDFINSDWLEYSS